MTIQDFEERGKIINRLNESSVETSNLLNQLLDRISIDDSISQDIKDLAVRFNVSRAQQLALVNTLQNLN